MKRSSWKYLSSIQRCDVYDGRISRPSEIYLHIHIISLQVIQRWGAEQLIYPFDKEGHSTVRKLRWVTWLLDSIHAKSTSHNLWHHRFRIEQGSDHFGHSSLILAGGMQRDSPIGPKWWLVFWTGIVQQMRDCDELRLSKANLLLWKRSMRKATVFLFA